MALSSGTLGNLFAATGARKESQALALSNFTIALTSSALQPVGDKDVEMVSREKSIVTVPAWLLFMYSELQKEIECLGNDILEIQRQELHPRHLTPNICTAYELALHYQRQLCESDAARLQNALRKAYLRFEAASKQFAGEVQMGIHYLAFSIE